MRFLFAGIWVVVGLGFLLSYENSRHGAQQAARVASNRTAALNEPPPVTIASIFAPHPISLAHLDRRKIRTLVATGDVIPARSVNYKMEIYHDFLYPFRRTAGFLRRADTTLINLEAPLMNGCPITVQGMTFCGDPRFVQGLNYAGVDVACTANNHIGNYAEAGIQETWMHLRAAHIQPCGLGLTAYRTIRGLRFAFLAYNCVGQRFDYAGARQEIRDARKHAQIVVVSVHWGKEYVAVPQVAPGIADDYPPKVAHWIIDSGADLIIGNHPHHIQGVEIYHGKLIAYAHGNFAFDQMFTVADCPGDANFVCSTREGVVGTYTFYGTRLISVRYRPVVIYDYAQPRWATPAQARIILNGMRQATQALARAGGH
ncbi:MAG TPA: CapA family protein [Chloroflexota bacterium]|nr:CapA family protein [Chloroflexota bacterium]